MNRSIATTSGSICNGTFPVRVLITQLHYRIERIDAELPDIGYWDWSDWHWETVATTRGTPTGARGDGTLYDIDMSLDERYRVLLTDCQDKQRGQGSLLRTWTLDS